MLFAQFILSNCWGFWGREETEPLCTARENVRFSSLILFSCNCISHQSLHSHLMDKFHSYVFKPVRKIWTTCLPPVSINSKYGEGLLALLSLLFWGWEEQMGKLMIFCIVMRISCLLWKQISHTPAPGPSEPFSDNFLNTEGKQIRKQTIWAPGVHSSHATQFFILTWKLCPLFS